MAAHAGSFDMILDTVAASHDLDAFSKLLARDGTLVLVGVPEHPHPSPAITQLIFKRRAIAGSLIGGIAETQEMLDFCAEHGVVSDIEMIRMEQIDRSEEHTSELQSLMRISYAVFCLKKTTKPKKQYSKPGPC